MFGTMFVYQNLKYPHLTPFFDYGISILNSLSAHTNSNEYWVPQKPVSNAGFKEKNVFKIYKFHLYKTNFSP